MTTNDTKSKQLADALRACTGATAVTVTDGDDVATSKSPAAVARGSVRSAVKTAAARVNGRRGGRPAHRPVVVDVADYRRATGRAPRGRAFWTFVAGADRFAFVGLYSTAVRRARVHFGAVGSGSVRVTLDASPMFETRAVLAGAYPRGYAGLHLTHALAIVGNVETTVACRRVSIFSLADPMASDRTAAPTCPVCRARVAGTTTGQTTRPPA